MSRPSPNMKAVLVLAQHKYFGPIIKPALDVERDSVDWTALGYGGQSGGTQTLISWCYCLFCDELPPKEWGYRDPFEGFGSLDRDIQVLLFQAQAALHGFVSLSVEDEPKSDLQKMIKGFAEQMEKDEKRKNLKIIKSE